MKTKEEVLRLREEIIEVCLALLEKGLIVRTWGNVSARLDEEHFLITPSGIKYKDLTPDMLPVVNIKDLSFEGDYKPSSELLVHRSIYQARSDAQFVIHTHQTYATCVGALGKKRLKGERKGEKVIYPVADYALPGTNKLSANIKAALIENSMAKSVIMSNHGSVSFGRDAAEAVNEAVLLEKAAKSYIFKICKTDINYGIEEGYSSHLENGHIVYEKEGTPERIKQVHKAIYAKRPDVTYILHNKSKAIMTISRRANHMKPLLDDFAQIIGTHIRIPTSDHAAIYIRKFINAVFVYNDGAFCLGNARDEAEAAAIILDKGCLAHIAVTRYGEGRFLSFFDCYKMNQNYRKNYSKLSNI